MVEISDGQASQELMNQITYRGLIDEYRHTVAFRTCDG